MQLQRPAPRIFPDLGYRPPMKWIAALVVAAVGIAHAEPEKKTGPMTADEMEHLAATTKPGHEVEVRTGTFLTFHRTLVVPTLVSAEATAVDMTQMAGSTARSMMR